MDHRTGLSSTGDQAPTITALGHHGPARPQCVALVPGTNAHFTNDVTKLLRERLRMAAMIALFGFAVFFFKHLFYPTEQDRSLVFHALVVGVLMMTCALLFLPRRWSLGQLRFMEMAIFGSMAAFFVHLQYINFN